jgi:hypothetical protein
VTEENKKPPRRSEFEEEIAGRMLATEINITNLFYRIDLMTKTLQKLDTAYYQAFPDRLDKDLRLEDQLRALQKAAAKPAPPRRLDQLRALRKRDASRNPDTSRKQS